MPTTLRRVSDEGDTTATDDTHRVTEANPGDHTARPAHAARAHARPVPGQSRAEAAATAEPHGEPQGDHVERRARHPQISRTLARDIARRNTKQLLPHAVTAGLIATAQTVHYAAAQAHVAGAAAVATGTVCASTGLVGFGLARRRGLLHRQWRAWAILVTLVATAWMVLVVAAGLSWASFAAALAADYVLAARWWQHHRHPHPVEPLPQPGPDVAIGDSLIVTFVQRWADNVARPGGVLPGSTLVYADAFDRGIEYTLYLDPGQQSLDQVRNNLGRIESGLRHKQEHLVVDPHESEDPALVTLRVITTSPVTENVVFSQLRYSDGAIPLGPYADGIGEATWRLYSDDSMWGGIVIGATGTGKSRLLEMLALEALYTGLTYVIHLDGQDGSSCPTLWNHAQEHYGVDEVDSLLHRLEQMMRHRNRVCGGTFTPTPELPGVLVIVDETNAVLSRDNVNRWAHLARQGRKCGIAVVMGDQDGSLDTFIKSVLRGQLRKGNGVGMKTEEAAQGQILGKGKLDLSELPDIAGYGYTLGNSQRRAPYKGRFLMAQKDADRARQRGQAVPSDLVLIEQWYADAPKIPLDAGTDTATTRQLGEPPDRQSPALEEGGSALASLSLPTVGGAAVKREPTPASALNLTDAQYQVFDTVSLGLATPADIADKLGLSRKHVTNTLAQLITRGLVTKSGAGKAVRYAPVRISA